MLSSWWREPGQAKAAALAAGIIAAAALAWFTFTTPERGHDPLATDMEKNSALYFAVERDMTRLVQDANAGTARTIALTDHYALVNLDDGSRYYVRTGEGRIVLAELLAGQLANAKPGTAPAVFSLPDVQPPATPIARMMRVIGPNWLTLVGPLLFIYVILAMNPLRGPTGLFRLARKPATRFRDVVGVDEAKEALQDIVAYLKHPQKFSQLGARPPKGVVLDGHAGTGKTLLARAVAGEAGVPFLSISGGDFGDMFMGVGVRRVKKLFETARSHAPCVIFIDEIDGLGRRTGGSTAGETENNRIINAILVELDGFAASSGIVVLGATNCLDQMDPALIRPGRFDRVCHLGLPSVDERERLFALYSGPLSTSGPTNFRQLARLSSGLSPASIAGAVNGAAMIAAKEDAAAVMQVHFERSLEQHLMGGTAAVGQSAMNDDDRRRIAVHEAGHALVAKLLDVGIVEKVSILKRGRALGATLVTSDDEALLQSEPQMRARMIMLLGGRAAEALVLGSASTGAANDLERVSSLAYRMVAEFGFSSDIGPFSYAGLPDRERRASVHPETIAEAREIIKGLERECARLLEAHRAALDRLTAHLIEHETVSGQEVDACLAGPIH
ncbi:MAG TPA: AAA family ATPase [Burkholderiales bacterium]|nr:AAA family ATPase [Burkholderiales bacterium]